MRIIFMGTPDFSVPALDKIIQSNHDVVAVYSQPPRRAGRGMAERMSPVHKIAFEAGIQVSTPVNLRGFAEQDAFKAHNADAAVIIAYGLILPKPILSAPRLGCYNLHASKLPRWRGAAPIQRAIMSGDEETAAMVMKMYEGLDTGPICMEKLVPIGPDMTAGELHDQLAADGAELIVAALDDLEQGTLHATPQHETGITYAAKINKVEAKIDFTRDASDVHNLIRGLSPFPGAWFETNTNGKRERIKVLASTLIDAHGTPGEVLANCPAPTIACGTGAIHLSTLQRAGKRPAPAEVFLRGFNLDPGSAVG